VCLKLGHSNRSITGIKKRESAKDEKGGFGHPFFVLDAQLIKNDNALRVNIARSNSVRDGE